MSMHGFRRVVLAVSLPLILVGCGPLLDQRGFTQAVSGSPIFADDAGNRAMTALTKGDYSAAENLAIGALRKDPKDPYALYTAGMVYQATGRYDLARQYYEVILVNQPQVTLTIPSQGGPQVRSMIDVAQANLLVVDKMLGRTIAGSALRSGRGPDITPQTFEPQSPQTASRGAVVSEMLGDSGSSAMPAAGRGNTQAETNVTSRFRILKRLLDEGLITPDEYSRRRATNIGALLPYSASVPPAMGLERPGPTDEQVVDRLKALSVALESRALSPAEHGAERLAILDALLPAEPRKIDLPVLPPKDVMEAATAVGRVERLRASSLVSAEEARRERDAVEKVLDSQLAKQPVSGTATGLRQGSANGKNGKSPASGGNNAGASLGTAKTEEAARSTWEKIKAKFPEELGAMEATIRSVDQGEKGTRWRILIGPMKNRAEAVKLCKVLKLHRQSCEATSY